MKLVTQEIAAELLANGKEMREHAGTAREPDHKPVVKFFDPAGAATWLITFAEPEEPDILFGLCRALHKPNYDERGVMLSCARNST